MNTKILIIAFALLAGFFVFKKCTDDRKPDFDKITQDERARKNEEFKRKKTAEAQAKRIAAQKQAEIVRGERPEDKRVVIENADFRAEFSTRGGTLAAVALKDPQYLEPPRDWNTGLRDESVDPVPVDLVTTNTRDYERFNPLRFDILSGLEGMLAESDYEIVEQNEQRVVFRYAQSGQPVTIYKKFELDPKNAPYQVWMTIRVVNTSTEKVVFRAGVSQHGYQHQAEAAGGMFSKPPNLLQGICRAGEDTYVKPWIDSDLANTPYSGIGDVSFAGVETNYFLSAMVPSKEVPVSCHVSAVVHEGQSESEKWGRVVSELRFAETELEAGQAQIYRIKNYLGPKQYRLLQATGYHLEKSVDFGWFWPICQVMLTILFYFQSLVSNWGVAIILLTVLVKVVLMPLTHKSFQSAEKMKALKPEIDKLNEKFKDDPAAKQKETMALYKQNKVNPLGGCLPSLLQMPIWFALYSTLRASPELYRAPFFGWIQDLSSPDPYFVTPVIMGAAMYVQQKFTPMMGDSAQAKMMLYFMPIMFSAMMLFLPSGLTLYILVNTVLSIAHQLYIHRRSSR